MNDQYIVVPAAGAGFFAILGQSLLTVAIAFAALYILFWWMGRDIEEKPTKEADKAKKEALATATTEEKKDESQKSDS